MISFVNYFIHYYERDIILIIFYFKSVLLPNGEVKEKLGKTGNY